jgi:integrase
VRHGGRRLGRHAPAEPPDGARHLRRRQEHRLLAACRASKAPQLAALVIVAMETGMRRGELLGLTWDRVDLSRGVIRLEVTKSGKRREVPMRQAVYDILAAMPEPRQGRVWKVKSTRTAWETAVEAAGLDDFHWHDLRHDFASKFVMRGGSLPALQAILGHASLTMTMRYAHLAPGHLRAEIARTERPGRLPCQNANARVNARTIPTSLPQPQPS